MVAGMRFKGRRISVGGSWGGAEARFGTWGRVLGGLGVVLGGLGRPVGESVALLGANMAEKSDNTAKRGVWANRWNPNLEEKRAPRGPNWALKGAKIDAKSGQKLS